MHPQTTPLRLVPRQPLVHPYADKCPRCDYAATGLTYGLMTRALADHLIDDHFPQPKDEA